MFFFSHGITAWYASKVFEKATQFDKISIFSFDVTKYVNT